MGFTDAVAALNQFKRRRIIRDYAIIGAVAATAYMEPMATADLDVIISVKSDDEYRRIFGIISEYAEGQDGMHQILGGVPVQVFPSSLMPLYQDTVETARQIRIGNMRTKVATAEHLILLGLMAGRVQDHFRIRHLLKIADSTRLTGLVERFDDAENNFAAGLQNLCGTSIPRKGEMASPPGADEL